MPQLSPPSIQLPAPAQGTSYQTTTPLQPSSGQGVAPPPLPQRRSVTVPPVNLQPVGDGSDDDFCIASDFNSPARPHSQTSSSFGGGRRRATPSMSPEFPQYMPPPVFGSQGHHHHPHPHPTPGGSAASGTRNNLSMSRASTQLSNMSDLALASNASAATLPPNSFHPYSHGYDDDDDGDTAARDAPRPQLGFGPWRPLSAVEYTIKALHSSMAVSAAGSGVTTPLIPPMGPPAARCVGTTSGFATPAVASPVIPVPPVLPPPLSSVPVAMAPQLEVSFSCHMGQRRQMEDTTHWVELPATTAGGPVTHFAAVYDGHNGCVAAELAADHVHVALQHSPHYATNVGAALVDALRAVDIAMLEHSAAVAGSGTTACIACVRGQELTVANLGDCRAVLATSDGRTMQLTRDHKVSCAIETQRILSRGGAAAFGRIDGLSVSRGVGDFEFKTPHGVRAGTDALSNIAEVSTTPLTSDCACVILASDGLWDKVSNQEAADAVLRYIGPASAAGPSPLSAGGPAGTPRDTTQMAAQALVDLAIHRGTSDNVSALILKLRPQWCG